MNQVKLIKSLKLEKWFLEEAGNPDSAVGRFISNFVFNFILGNLVGGKKKDFLETVAQGENEAILAFVQKNIPGFENQIGEELKKKIQGIKAQALNSHPD